MSLLSASSLPRHVIHLSSHMRVLIPSLQPPSPCRFSASTAAAPPDFRGLAVWERRVKRHCYAPASSSRCPEGVISVPGSGSSFAPSPVTANPWLPTFRHSYGHLLSPRPLSSRDQGAGQDFGQMSLSWYSTTPICRAQQERRPSDPHHRLERTQLKKRLSQPLAHEQVWNVPNMLTFSRLFLTPVIGYLVVEGSQPGLALGLFCYAGITDLADGWIARRWKLLTVVGSVIDPMADKALMTVLTVALAAKGALPIWLAGLILGRDIGLAISAIYYRWISLPPPKTFKRYWDFSLPSAEVRPTTISKINTALQLALVGILMAQPILEPWSGVGMTSYLGILEYIVAVTTIWSGASYIYSKDAVRILTKPKPK